MQKGFLLSQVAFLELIGQLKSYLFKEKHFRYLLSLNDHYVVTQALEFVHLYLKKIRVFSFNYMKNLEDKVQRIAERKVG